MYYSKDSDQPVHPCSLIRVFADRMCLLQPPDEQNPIPYWVDVQADLYFCWSHRSYCRFWHAITKTPLFKYAENFTTKKWNFSDKKFWYFSYFCSKHRLWVLVRTASMRQFQRVPTIYVLSRNKKNIVNPCKPHFYHIKVGFKVVKII